LNNTSNSSRNNQGRGTSRSAANTPRVPRSSGANTNTRPRQQQSPRQTSYARQKAAAKLAAEKKGRRREWFDAFVEAALIAFILFFIFWPTKIDGHSMENAFKQGDRAVMSRVMVYLNFFSRGDIVVCNGNEKTGSKDIVKRIVGMPNDRITITDGEILINGVKHYEPYAAGYTDGEIDLLLGSDEYFVLGDNREISEDSRAFGPVKKKNIIARVVFRYFPFTNLGAF